ncbi:MAG: phosphonate C-P lyase system protein PhnG [Chitinispirillia bacterium]|jgi:alpha-D-ribose 1-methylphosphonate 5-triphosphate synthase subunit PhnG
MSRKKVFEMLMQGDKSKIAECASKLRKTIPFTILKKPTQELIMFQVEESVERIDFNVGEVLVTSAEVRINDTIGYSMVMDLDDQKAFDCAFLMGVYDAELEEKKIIEALVEDFHIEMVHKMREEREIVSSTRVNFEIMGGQDPGVKHNAVMEDS